MFESLMYSNNEWTTWNVGDDCYELYTRVLAAAKCINRNLAGLKHIDNVCVIDRLTGEVIFEAEGWIGE